MSWKLVLWLISFISFWGYATWYIVKNGIPKSWSNTFYKLGEIYNNRNKGYIFTGILWLMALPLLPVALEGGHNLMFPVISAIALIGAAPAFKDSKMEYWAHMIGSYVSVILGTLVFGISYNLWFVSILLLLLIAGLHFKWKPDNKTMWIESLVIFAGQVIVLIKDVL